jgi:hypothetical protein
MVTEAGHSRSQNRIFADDTGFRRRLGANSKRYLRFTKARWNAISVDGFSTMADRSSRAGRISPTQRLAMMRSIGRTFGALARDRFRINS